MNAALESLASTIDHERATGAAILARAVGRWPKGTTAALAHRFEHDSSPRVRATALVALIRRAPLTRAQRVWNRAVGDTDAAVRLRAVQLAPFLDRRRLATAARQKRDEPSIVTALVRCTSDVDDLVAEGACFALGEVELSHDIASAVNCLVDIVEHNEEPLVREAAVAALGSIGDERGRDAILLACNDKPAVRRRAVLALAAFEGVDVEAAIKRALTDVDWQVRQAAEDLSDPPHE